MTVYLATQPAEGNSWALGVRGTQAPSDSRVRLCESGRTETFSYMVRPYCFLPIERYVGITVRRVANRQRDALKTEETALLIGRKGDLLKFDCDCRNMEI